MLKLVKIKDSSNKWNLLSEFKPETDCFIVSDIKTKLSVESELLAKHSFLPGLCVTRANEFYKELFYTLDLNWNLVSNFFVRELFAEFCVKYKEPWIRNLQSSKFFFDFFNSFLVVLFHPENFKLFVEWFDKRQKPTIWKPWFELSQNFFYFLKSKKVLHEYGLKALLLHHLPSLDEISFKKDKIFLDLSFSFDFCEKEIFQEISRHKEVCILCPELENRLVFEQTSDVYQKLEEELGAKTTYCFHSDLNKTQEVQKPLSANFFKVKSETQIEEIRKTVIQVCKWLKAEVPLQDIVIFAPDIEEYWFILKAYFEREKIPVKKSVFIRMADSPYVKYFLSSLRIHLGYFTFEDLEYFSFFRESKRNFSKFKTYYFRVPDRNLAKKLLFKDKERSPNEKITGRQFIEWALSFWPKKADAFLLDAVLKTFLKFPIEESLKASAWLNLFESELFALEIELEKEDNQGISCLSFNALHSTKSPYVFIMGLDEESLKKTSLGILNESEREAILKDLGFPLPFSHPKEKENNLLWFLQSSRHKELYLSFFSYDFKGDIKTAASVYFLSEFLFHTEEKEIPESLSWDNNKRQESISTILRDSSVEKEQVKALESSFQDRKQSFFQKEKMEISPSRLKLYMDCPFKYAARKMFFIKEENLVERELSALSKGVIVHELFENLLKKYPDLCPTKEQIEEMVEILKPKSEKLIYEKQWLLIREYLKNLLYTFLEKEKENRSRFPLLQPKAFEAEIFAYWDQKKGELDSQGTYPFKARIDRIDKDKATNTYIIKDYKASKGELTHISSWIKENKEEFQLTFYAQALEKGLIKNIPSSHVSALFYSIYNDDFSAKGFVEKNSPLEELMGEGVRGHKKERSVLYQAIEKSNARTQALIQLMEEGQFSPKPRKKEICKKCLYRTWCRVETLKDNQL